MKLSSMQSISVNIPYTGYNTAANLTSDEADDIGDLGEEGLTTAV